MAENSFDVLLRFLIDQASVSKVKADAKNLASDIGESSKDGFQKSGQKAADAFSKGMENVLQAQIKNVMSDAIAAGIDRASSVALVAGGVIAGALIKASSDYIKNTEKSTQVTREWKAATESLKDSYSDIGELSAQAILPVLQTAASVARTLANIAQQNPELIRGGLQIGAALLVVGTIGKAVASGIRLVADVSYIVSVATAYKAAQLHNTAADKELLAAGLKGRGGAATVASATGPIGVALTAGIIGGIGYKEFLDYLDSVKEKSGGAARAGFEFIDMLLRAMELSNPIAHIGRALKDIETGWNATVKALEESDSPLAQLIRSLQGVASAAPAAAMALSDVEKALVDSFLEMKQQEAKINSAYTASISQVNSDYQSSLQSAVAQNSAAMAQIASASAAAVANIIASFESDMANMAAQYAAQQASIIAAGAEQVRQIQENAQEQLIQLAEQHAKRVEQLTNARDALGLAQENRDYKQQQAAIKRQEQQAIAQAKRNTQLQLQQAEQAYQQQVAQREAQYQADLEAQQQATAEQFAAQQEAYQQELASLAAQHDAELKQLEQKHKQDLATNRRAFMEQYIALKNEKAYEMGLLNQFYADSLAALQAWVASYSAELAALDPTGASGTAGYETQSVHDYSGYAYTGTYRMAQNGIPQWVMSGEATAAAEKMVGGKLNEQNAFASMSGAGNQYITVQAGNGATLMQVKRALRENTRDISKSLTASFKAVG